MPCWADGVKEQLKETKAAGKHIKIYWVPAHGGITGNEKGKHSIRLGRDSQIPIPTEDMRSLRRKSPKRNPSCGTRRWDESVDSNTSLFLDNGPNPWFAKCKLNRRVIDDLHLLPRSGTQPWHVLILCQTGSAHVKHLKTPPHHVFWQC
jgi:hypothetical protein